MAKVQLYFKRLQVGAEQGNPDVQCALGSCYFDGIGAAKDEVKAVELWRSSAELNCSAAKEALKSMGKAEI